MLAEKAQIEALTNRVEESSKKMAQELKQKAKKIEKQRQVFFLIG